MKSSMGLLFMVLKKKKEKEKKTFELSTVSTIVACGFSQFFK